MGGGGGGGRRGAGHGVLGAGETHSVTSPPTPPRGAVYASVLPGHCSLALVASVASFRGPDPLTRARQAPCGVQELMGDGGGSQSPGEGRDKQMWGSENTSRHSEESIRSSLLGYFLGVLC